MFNDSKEPFDLTESNEKFDDDELGDKQFNPLIADPAKALHFAILV